MHTPSKEKRILVISHSCVRAVNRSVYRLMVNDDISIHLVVPLHPDIPGVPDPTTLDPFPVTFLPSSGPHDRLMRAPGLKAIIKDFRPTHVISETDIASLLTFSILNDIDRATQIWLVSVENMRRSFLKEAWNALRSRDFRTGVGGVLIWSFVIFNRHRIDHIFTVSKAGTYAVKFLGYRGPITQIPLGFDPLLFNLQPPDVVRTTRDRLGLTKLTFAYFGRLVPEKGVDKLIAALSKLKHLEWQFLIDSFSEYRSPYEAQVAQLLEEYGIKDRTVFFEAHHDEIPTYINAADVVVLPSVSTPRWIEQYGRVVPEAMACRKIVVGSSSGAIPELIGEAGIIVPEGDIERLAATLEKLLKSPSDELDHIRQTAYERAHGCLSIRQQAEIWLNTL